MEVLDQPVGDVPEERDPARAVVVVDLARRVVGVVHGTVVGRHGGRARVAIRASLRRLLIAGSTGCDLHPGAC